MSSTGKVCVSLSNPLPYFRWLFWSCLGVGVGTVDTTFSTRTSSQLGVYSLPTVVIVYEEQYSHYRGVISYENIKKFVTSQLPSHLVQSVSISFIKNVDLNCGTLSTHSHNGFRIQ